MPESRAPDGLEILTGMNAWQATHSIATLAGTGAALDECLMALHRRMLTDTIARSDQAIRSARPPAEQPGCPACGGALAATRATETPDPQRGGDVPMERSDGVCPAS